MPDETAKRGQRDHSIRPTIYTAYDRALIVAAQARTEVCFEIIEGEIILGRVLSVDKYTIEIDQRDKGKVWINKGFILYTRIGGK